MKCDQYEAAGCAAWDNTGVFPPGGRTVGCTRIDRTSHTVAKAAGDCRTPRRFAFSNAAKGALASWTAPALWRFRALHRRIIPWAFSFLGVMGAWVAAAPAAPLPADWQHEQRFDATAAGLFKLSLPTATLDAARPGLEDLRLYDDAGREVPYLIERPRPGGKVVREAKSFQVVVNGSTTVLTLETGLTQPLDGVTVDSPATAFLKAVRIEGSADGQGWQTLARGQPIFRQPDGASQLRLSIPGRHMAVAAADGG